MTPSLLPDPGPVAAALAPTCIGIAGRLPQGGITGPGVLIGDRFEIEREAGTGGMGVVFRARDQRTGATVAVKILRGQDPIAVERFDREAETLAEIQHPGVVRYIAHGATDAGDRYIAMEWLEGEDLERRFARGRLTVEESLSLIRRTADALSTVHARGLMHRDIKPSNIFLVDGDLERVKLLDFGITRRATSATRLTQSGMLIGTPAYMAPEQARGLPDLDARSDVFSLGCVLFECLTGKPAFDGANPMAILAKVILQPVAPLREVVEGAPEQVEQLLGRMLAKDPAGRPRDAGEVAAAIDALGDLGRHRRALAVTLVEASPSSPGSLTLSEQRVVSVVLACAPPAAAESALEDLRASLDRAGGRLHVLADGSLLVTVWGAGSAVDRVERAARCALTLRDRQGDVPIHVMTGRGVVSARAVEGAAIDRGVRTLGAIDPGTIRIDHVSAGMLGARFITDADARGITLRGERASGETEQLLLGKPSKCVGRSREIGLLDTLFAAVTAEPAAGALLVMGPAGAGKSRLVQELFARIRSRQAPVEILSGRGDSLGDGLPFGMIADAIRGAARILADEPLVSQRAKLAAYLGRRLAGAALARVTAFLGELAGIPLLDDGDPALRAARENAMLMGDAMRAAWEEWIAAECAAQPVLLVLEDLHLGDAATVRLIDETLRDLRDLPIFVVALARPEVCARFPAIWEERSTQVLRLVPLPRKSSERIVREALGESIDVATVARIVDRAEGNPFYLEELIRAIAAGRGDDLPDSVLGTVEARLDSEGRFAKRILRAASVFGDRFSARGVAALLGGDAQVEEVGIWLEALASREIIARDGGAEDAGYTFRHALVRDAAYAMLTDADRALGHYLAGTFLERIGHADAMAVAEHFRRGGEPLRAVRYYRRAAEQALEANDLAAVDSRSQRGVASGASGEDLGALYLVQAEASVWRGDLVVGEQRCLEAIALLSPGSTAWFRAVSQLVAAAGKLGDFDLIERWLPRARMAATEGAGATRISCLCLSASHLMFGGRQGAADALVEEIDRAVGDDPRLFGPARAALSVIRAFRASGWGDPVASLDHLSAALAAFQEASDQRNACMIRANIGLTRAALGDLEGAEDCLRAALVAAERLGLRDLAAMTVHRLGHVLAYRGKIEEALSLEQRAVSTFQQQRDARLEGLARTYLARIDLLAGEITDAEREARLAAELLAASPLRAVAGAVLARALLAAAQPDEALRVAREAFTLLESLETPAEGEPLIRLVYAEALAAGERDHEFVSAILSARAHLLDRAIRISDPAWRARFLTEVPEIARTLDLAALAMETPDDLKDAA